MQKVQIIINSQRCDISELDISFEFVNPFFTEQVFQASYNYSHDIPLTPANKKALGFVNRFDVNKTKKHAYKLIIDGVIFMTGIAYIDGISDHAISLSIISDAAELVKKINEKLLHEIPMDTVKIYDDGQSPIDKVDSWENHMNQIMSQESVTGGTHKFPMIWTNGYDGQRDKNNYIFSENRCAINATAIGKFMKNFPIPIAYKPNESTSIWPFSIAPCPRIMYVLQKIFDYYGIKKTNGTLWDDYELQQMICFAGVTLDNIIKLDNNFNEVTNTNQTIAYELNVSTSNFNLADLVPKSTIYSVFKMLNEIYGVVFNIDGSTLTAVSFKEVLQKPLKDYSKYYLDNITDNVNEEKIINIRYSKESDHELPIVFLITEDGTFSNKKDTSEIGIIKNNDELASSITFDHFPMKSSLFGDFEGFINNEQLINDIDLFNRTGWGELLPRFIYPYAISSINGTKSERKESLYVGCYRGIFSTPRYYNGNINDVEWFDEPWPYNYSKVRWESDTTETFPALPYKFGKSIYLYRWDGTYENNLKYFYELLENHKIIQVESIIPVHVLMQLKNFTDCKHIIKDKRGNQVGILSKISGSISATGIGQITLEYRVSN